MVNDGSKDNSEGVINSFLSEHKEVKAQLSRQQNAGAGVARNVGISKSKGEYIVFLDSDDYVEDDYLERVNEKIVSDKADVVFIDIVREKEGGAVIRHEDMSRFASLGKERLIRWQLTGKAPWGGCRKVVRSSIIKDNNLTYAPIKVGEESIFSFRILQIADRISFQPKAIYHYVETDTSLTALDDPENSVKVFDFVTGSLENLEMSHQYIRTIRAMAVCALVVIINVVTLDNEIKNKYKTSKRYYSYFRKYLKGDIDVDSLEKRVQLCVPFVKFGFIGPIILAAYLRKITRRIK